MENPKGFNPALPWKIYTVNTADSMRFCAYSPPSRTPLLHYRAPRSSSFTYAHFPSAFPPIILPTVRKRLPYPPFSMSESGTTAPRMTDEALSSRTLLYAVLSRSAAHSVEPFTGPPPLDHTGVLPPLAQGDRHNILSILMSRSTQLTSTHSRWRSAGRRLFLAGIIILLLVATFRRCRRARRFIHYLLRKLLKFYRQCWRRLYGRGSDHDDASDRSCSSVTSSGRSQDHDGNGRLSVADAVQAPGSLAGGQREEGACKAEGKTDGSHSRCRSAPGSLVTPAGREGEGRGARATEGWLGLPRWGGFRDSPRGDYRKKLGIRPSSFSVSPFARGAEMGVEGSRSLGPAFRDSSGKSTSSSIHRALQDFSLYIEASANGGLHQCPAPTNTNIPSCFFLPSLISAANSSPGAETDAVAAAAAGDAGASAGPPSRFCECCCSQVAGAHGSDTVCTGSACPYSTRKGEPVMIFQEAIYSSDSSPPASVCQGESSLTRVTEEGTGHDSGSVKSPRTPGRLTGEDEVTRPREVNGLAALFRRATSAQDSATSTVLGHGIQMKLDDYERRQKDELVARGGTRRALISDTPLSPRGERRTLRHKKSPKSSFAIRWAVVKRRLHRLYQMLLDLLRSRLQKNEPEEEPRRAPFTRTSNTPGVEDSASAEVDSQPTSYFQELYRLVRLAFPKLWSYEGGCLVLLISALVLRTCLSIWIASINGNVVQTIVQRNLGGFVRSLGVLIAYALPAAVVNAAIQFFEKMLALQLRRNLTIYLTRRYLKGLTFYRVAALDCRVPHPDEVMTASLSSFSLLTASLFSSFLKPLVDIVFLSRALVKHLGIGAPVTLVAWYALTAFAMHAVAPPLGKRTARLQELEAKYRALHGDVLHHSEEIAFYGGARHAERRLESAFDILYAYKQQVLMLYHLVLSSMDTLLAKHLAVVVGYAVVAGPSFGRAGEEGRPPSIRAIGAARDQSILWKAGSAGSATRAPEVAITHDYIRNSSLLINLAKAIGRILMSYKDVQQLGGITARLNAFLRVIEELDSGFFCTRNILTGTLARRSTISKGIVKQLPTATAVQFKDVAVVTPAGQVLLDHVSFALPSGHNLFLLGPNGCGKTSLFRILGGLWPLLEGEITIPMASKLFYIPQRPYMPEGTLRDQVIYPMTYEAYKSLPAESDRVIDDHLEELLDVVGLDYILKRCPEGWDTWGDWEDILSGGEKQRMAFARLLFHKPVFAILDEATSAVSVDLEGALYRRCKEAKITLITISHNISLLKYHDFVLRFSGLGAPGRRWSLESTEGLKRLDSYSFLLNITPASGQADATHLSSTADTLRLQCPPAATAPLPSARSGETLLPPTHGSPPLEAALISNDSAGHHQPALQGDVRLAKDVDTPSVEKGGSTALPHIVLLSPTSRPNNGIENSAVPPSNVAKVNQRPTALPSRGSRVSSPARADGRAFPGAPSSLSPAAVGSAAAEATVSTIMSMRKNQQDIADPRQ